jgi:5-methylcytosine-specific restriction enzyme subunit McrC
MRKIPPLYEYGILTKDKFINNDGFGTDDNWENLKKSLQKINSDFKKEDNNDGNKGILYLEGDRIRAGSIVGVIATPVATIEVLPKIFKYRDDEEGEKNRTGLIRLLEYVYDIPIKLPEAHLRRYKNLLEYYIRIFADMLYDRLMSNFRRDFVAVKDNSRYLKGRLLVAENMRYNYIHKERFFVRYDEFSPDNLLNRILKFTCKLLFDYTTNSQTENILNRCLSFFEEVSDVEVTSDDVECLRITRITEDYRQIIDLVRLFIRYYSPTTEAGRHRSFAIAFDMEELFERFCFRFINRNNKDINDNLSGCSFYRHKSNMTLIDEPKKFKLETDISITEGNDTKVIIDTKYKELKEATEGGRYKEHRGISQGDLYQLFAYLKKYKCQNGILLYPQYDNGFRINKNDDYYDMKYDGETNLHIRQVSLACLSERGWHKEMINEFRGCFDWLEKL